MTTKPPRRVPKETAATTAEIIAAIESMMLAQVGRLKRYAREPDVRRLRRKADGEKGDDLFQIAVDELMNGTRRWIKENVDIAGFLALAMRSISNNWVRTFKEDETAIRKPTSLKRMPMATSLVPWTPCSDGRADPEERMIAEEGGTTSN